MSKYSIIVPVFNTEKYLADCLDTLVRQTLRDYEIVVVNDGSTDSSASIIEEYRKDHPNLIKVVTQENRGLLLARRAGYKKATGSILMTVDSDDCIREDALEQIDGCFQKYDSDVVCFGFTRTGDFSDLSERNPFSESRYIARDEKSCLYEAICGTRTMNFAWNKAIKRSLVDVDRDYSEYEGLSCAEDLLQTLPVLDGLDSFYYLNEALYYYRVNASSITKAFNISHYWDNQRVGLLRLAYAERWEKEIPESDLVNSSLFMSLRESCEAIVRVAELYSFEEAEPIYKTIEEGELYRRSSACEAAVNKLRPFYRMTLLLFDRKYYRLLKRTSSKMLRLKRRFHKDNR